MPNTNSENSYEHTVAIVRDAIPRMSAHRIPITPSNYAVWYEYLGRANLALRAEMDALLSRQQPISEAEMRDLYARYLDQRGERVQAAKTTLGQIINALISHIAQTDGHYDSFATELGDIAASLVDETTADDLNTIIDRATRATNAALERGAELRQQFSTLAAEMQHVRGELERSHEEARTDALTGVCNRLGFQETLLDLPQAALDDSHAPCLMMIDVDFFKRVNDTYGHLVGDHVLQAVAQEIKAIVRGRDIVARYGGEEFAVLLRDTPRSGCVAVAEHIRSGIERNLIALPEGAGEPLAVTVSIGGAWLRTEEAVEGFVGRADRGLYRSKQKGRNQVTWEGAPAEA